MSTKTQAIMRQKNLVIRSAIYNELLNAYPTFQTSSDIANTLGIPTYKARYYLEDMYKSQGFPPKVVRIKYSIPRRRIIYRAIP